MEVSMALWERLVFPALHALRKAFLILWDFITIDVFERGIMRRKRRFIYRVPRKHRVDPIDMEYDLP